MFSEVTFVLSNRAAFVPALSNHRADGKHKSQQQQQQQQSSSSRRRRKRVQQTDRSIFCSFPISFRLLWNASCLEGKTRSLSRSLSLSLSLGVIPPFGRRLRNRSGSCLDRYPTSSITTNERRARRRRSILSSLNLIKQEDIHQQETANELPKS